MRQFLVSVTLISFISSIVLMIMPEGGLKKYVKLSLSLTFTAFIVSSFTAGNIGQLSLPSVNIEDRSGEFYNSVIEKAKENTEQNLKNAICKKYSVSESDIDITAEVEGDTDSLEISRVNIKLRGVKNTVKLTYVKKYAENLMNTEVAIQYDGD